MVMASPHIIEFSLPRHVMFVLTQACWYPRGLTWFTEYTPSEREGGKNLQFQQTKQQAYHQAAGSARLCCEDRVREAQKHSCVVLVLANWAGLGRKEACVSLWGVLMPGSVRKQISTNIACAGWYYPDKTFHRGETQPNTAVKHPPLLSYLAPEPLDLRETQNI